MSLLISNDKELNFISLVLSKPQWSSQFFWSDLHKCAALLVENLSFAVMILMMTSKGDNERVQRLLARLNHPHPIGDRDSINSCVKNMLIAGTLMMLLIWKLSHLFLKITTRVIYQKKIIISNHLHHKRERQRQIK